MPNLQPWGYEQVSFGLVMKRAKLFAHNHPGCSNSPWRVGCYWNGVLTNVTPTIHRTPEEAQAEIRELEEAFEEIRPLFY